MSYIIVWRNSHRDPFPHTDDHDFIEHYSTFENAESEAKKIQEAENDGSQSPWYFDYQIYEESNG